MKRTGFRFANAQPKSRHARATATLAAAVMAGGCIALASHNPMAPLQAYARLSLQWKGARFISRDRARLQQTLNDCGPTALADLLDLAGLSVPPAENLRRLAGTRAGGTTLADLSVASAVLGLPVFSVQWDPIDLDLLPLPSLVWVERRHFVVLARRARGDSLEVHDPAAGHYVMSVERFTRLWSGAALVPLESFSPRLKSGG